MGVPHPGLTASLHFHFHIDREGGGEREVGQVFLSLLPYSLLVARCHPCSEVSCSPHDAYNRRRAGLPLPHRRGNRPGRDGGRVSGGRYAARPHGRPEDAAAEATSDPERRARFIQEARSASILNHPHIVTIYDVGEHQGATFIAMELVAGAPLDKVMRDGPCQSRRRSSTRSRSSRRSRSRTMRASSIATSSPRTWSSPATAGPRSSTSGSRS